MVKAVSGMTQIGLRAIGSARRGELQAAVAYASHLVTAEQFHTDGPDRVLATIPENRAVYLTIDADGLDPTEMPAVMAPTPGGLYFPPGRAAASRGRPAPPDRRHGRHRDRAVLRLRERPDLHHGRPIDLERLERDLGRRWRFPPPGCRILAIRQDWGRRLV
jgi:hypothetical protein